MSTVACAAIQILDTVPGFPSDWLSGNSTIFLDLPVDFDFALSKNVEELTNINELQLSGVYGFSVPKSPKNQFILRDWVDANTYDFTGVPVNVRAYSGGDVLTQRLMYIRESRWSDEAIECALVNDESHWAIGAGRLRLNQIPYDDFVFTAINVFQNMQNNESYADGDAGIYFQIANYGNPFKNRRILVEYLRPWYHVLGVLHKGFKYLGWRFECELLETEIGRRWIAYLIDPDFYKTGSGRTASLLAQLSAREYEYIPADHLDDAEPSPDAEGQTPIPFTISELLDYDTVIDDPLGQYTLGQFNGFGTYHFEASFVYVSFWNVSHFTWIELWHISNEDIRTLVKSTRGGVLANLMQQRELFIKTDEPVFLLPGEKVEVRWRGSSNGTGSSYFRDEILAGSLRITPVSAYPVQGDTINPGTMLRPDFFLDFCKGILHVMRGRVDTDIHEKTVRFMPNYPMRYLDPDTGEEIEGYYHNGELVTVDELQIVRSEVTRPPDYSQPRYLILEWKDGNDVWVRKYNEGRKYPVFSKLVDLGEEYSDTTPLRLTNPYFEATVNDWSQNFVLETNGIPMDLPHLLDHEPTDDKVQISTDIGPRLLITKGWHDVTVISADLMEHHTLWAWGSSEHNVFGAHVSYPWGYMLALGADSAGDPNPENLIYGDENIYMPHPGMDLYKLFWKRWAFESFKNFTVDLLVFMRTRDFTNWDLRSVYALLTGGKRSFAYLKSINQYYPCRQISTQAIFTVNSQAIAALGNENENNPCDSYSYNITWTEVDGVYTFSVDTDSPNTVTVEWRYSDETTWTLGTVVSNPDRSFYVRVIDTECGNQPNRIIHINPCAGNIPVLYYTWRLDTDTDPDEYCITVHLGGQIEDEIDSIDLEVSVDGDSAVPYTIDTEICGATEEICVFGTVSFLNDCDPIPVELCIPVPPQDIQCGLNLPDVDYTHVGLDAYNLRLGGSMVSPPSVWHFQFKDVDAEDDTAQVWDTKSPIVKAEFMARVVMWFCDACPKVCGPWKLIPSEMSLTLVDGEWNFDKMVQEDWDNVLSMLNDNDTQGLMKFHNEKKLSPYHYCCGGDGKLVTKWFRYGWERYGY